MTSASRSHGLSQSKNSGGKEYDNETLDDAEYETDEKV